MPWREPGLWRYVTARWAPACRDAPAKLAPDDSAPRNSLVAARASATDAVEEPARARVQRARDAGGGGV